MGQIFAAKLKATGETVVVVNRDASVAAAASQLGYLTVQRSISRDGVLEQINTKPG